MFNLFRKCVKTTILIRNGLSHFPVLKLHFWISYIASRVLGYFAAILFCFYMNQNYCNKLNISKIRSQSDFHWILMVFEPYQSALSLRLWEQNIIALSFGPNWSFMTTQGHTRTIELFSISSPWKWSNFRIFGTNESLM